MLIDDGLELLTEQQCHDLLRTQSLGRVGVTVGGLPVIMPVNYTCWEHDIVFRSGPGTKLRAASAGAVIAFEIDSWDAAQGAGWSVLAIGRAEEVDASTGAPRRARPYPANATTTCGCARSSSPAAASPDARRPSLRTCVTQ
jgi:hypothetical protein